MHGNQIKTDLCQANRRKSRVTLILATVFIAGCTALDTTHVPSAKVDEKKPHVGRYYMLPKALITIQGTPDSSGNLDVEASVTLAPDSRQRYFLRWTTNPFYEDVFNNIDVDADGMISTVNYTTEDKTPVILNDLLTTAVNLGKIANTLGFSPFAADNGTSPNRLPFKYTFDPFDEAETRIVKSDLWKKQRL